MTEQVNNVTESVVAENATVDNSKNVEASNTLLNASPVEKPAEVKTLNDFKSMLGEDLREMKALQNFKDINDLAKSYIHQNQLIGKKVNDFSKEDINAFMEKIGRPSSPEKYELPEEIGADSIARFKNAAHKAGLTQEQAKAVIDDLTVNYREVSKAEESRMEELKNNAVAELKKTFGESAYEKRIDAAARAIKQLGGEELLKTINESGLGINPDVIKVFSKISKDYLEADKIVEGDKAGVFGITPEEAKKQKDVILGTVDNAQAYVNARHPNHKVIYEQVTNLNKILWG